MDITTRLLLSTFFFRYISIYINNRNNVFNLQIHYSERKEKKMKTSISKILIVFALLISSIFFTANISASYENEYAEIRQNMEELGISEDNQDAILNNLEKGILPDSLLGDNSKITSINKETVGNKKTQTNIEVIKYEELNNIIGEDESLILSVKQDGCPACDQVKPILEDYAKNSELRFVSIIGNKDGNGGIYENYNIDVTPTIIFFDKGQEKDRLIGVFDKAALKEKIEGIYSKSACESCSVH